MAKIVVVDDHPVVRRGIESLIDLVPGWLVVGSFGTISDAIKGIDGAAPNVLILDLNLKDEHGFDLLRHVKKAHPETKIVVVSGYLDDHSVASSLFYGATGIVSKLSMGDDILTAIDVVRQGGHYASPDISDSFRDILKSFHKGTSGLKVPELTSREIQVLILLASGAMARETSKALNLSQKTVDNHRAHIFKKTGAKNIVELTHHAIQHGYIAAGSCFSSRENPTVKIRLT